MYAKKSDFQVDRTTASYDSVRSLFSNVTDEECLWVRYGVAQLIAAKRPNEEIFHFIQNWPPSGQVRAALLSAVLLKTYDNDIAATLEKYVGSFCNQAEELPEFLGGLLYTPEAVLKATKGAYPYDLIKELYGQILKHILALLAANQQLDAKQFRFEHGEKAESIRKELHIAIQSFFSNQLGAKHKHRNHLVKTFFLESAKVVIQKDYEQLKTSDLMSSFLNVPESSSRMSLFLVDAMLCECNKSLTGQERMMDMMDMWA